MIISYFTFFFNLKFRKVMLVILISLCLHSFREVISVVSSLYILSVMGISHFFLNMSMYNSDKQLSEEDIFFQMYLICLIAMKSFVTYMTIMFVT